MIINDYLLTPEYYMFYLKYEFVRILFLICLYYFYRKKVVRRVRRLNPLSNTRAMLRLNPYAAVLKRKAILQTRKRLQKKPVASELSTKFLI